MKWWLIITLMLIVPMAFASQTIQVNESTPLLYQFIIAGQLTNVTTVTLSITDLSNNSEILSAEPANQLSDGVYYYNFTPSQIGSYIVTWESLYDGNIYHASDDILVVENLKTIAQDTEQQVENVFSIFILFIVGLSIAAMGRYIEEPVFYIFSGVYFIGSSAYLVFENQGWSFPMFFALFGLILAWKGIGDYLTGKGKDRYKNEFDDYE